MECRTVKNYSILNFCLEDGCHLFSFDLGIDPIEVYVHGRMTINAALWFTNKWFTISLIRNVPRVPFDMRLFVLDEPFWGQGQSWRQIWSRVRSSRCNLIYIKYFKRNLCLPTLHWMRSARWSKIFDQINHGSPWDWNRLCLGGSQIKYSFTNWPWNGLTYRKIKILLDVVIADIWLRSLIKTFKFNKRIDTLVMWHNIFRGFWHFYFIR